jgi:DNA-binding response OmpR family regulator
VLRRTARQSRTGQERHRVGGLVVDIARREVHLDDNAVATTPAEFTLLACLAAAPGRVFTRDVLLERLGGFDREVTARSIDMHVMNLRRKLEPVPTKPRYLLTVYGAGYKLNDDAT